MEKALALHQARAAAHDIADLLSAALVHLHSRPHQYDEALDDLQREMDRLGALVAMAHTPKKRVAA